MIERIKVAVKETDPFDIMNYVFVGGVISIVCIVAAFSFFGIH